MERITLPRGSQKRLNAKWPSSHPGGRTGSERKHAHEAREGKRGMWGQHQDMMKVIPEAEEGASEAGRRACVNCVLHGMKSVAGGFKAVQKRRRRRNNYCKLSVCFTSN